MELRGIYLDGLSSRENSVRIEIRPDAFLLLLDDGRREAWDVSTTHIEKEFEPRSGQAIFSNERHQEARLFLRDAESYRRLLPLLKKQHAFTLNFTWRFLGAALLASVILLTGGYFLVKEESRVLAPLIPEKIQLALVDKMIGPQEDLTACEKNKGAAVSKIASRIASDNGIKPVRVFVADDKDVNAFALPARTVLVNRGMIREIRAESELAGVLAHEIGHIHQHHPQQAFLRTIGLGIFIGMTIGSTDIATLSNVAMAYGNMQYSREKEIEADDTARDFMRKSGIDPAGIGAFFKRIESRESRSSFDKTVLSYLSTHPPTESRIAKFTSGRKDAFRAILSKKEWAALKTDCSKKR